MHESQEMKRFSYDEHEADPVFCSANLLAFALHQGSDSFDAFPVRSEVPVADPGGRADVNYSLPVVRKGFEVIGKFQPSGTEFRMQIGVAELNDAGTGKVFNGFLQFGEGDLAGTGKRQWFYKMLARLCLAAYTIRTVRTGREGLRTYHRNRTHCGTFRFRSRLLCRTSMLPSPSVSTK